MRSLLALALLIPSLATAQRGGSAPFGARTDSTSKPILLTPARVWTGVEDAPHERWVVLVRGDRIEAVGPRADVTVPADATTIALPATTLVPGLFEGHSHLLLHPYN